MDFLGVHKNLTLTARQCVQVEILNDSILEDSEWFMFTVSSTDPSVLVAKGELEVTIADDDCKLLLSKLMLAIVYFLHVYFHRCDCLIEWIC